MEMKFRKLWERHKYTILFMEIGTILFPFPLAELQKCPVMILRMILVYMCYLGVGELVGWIFHHESLQEFSEWYPNFLQDDTVKVRLDDKTFCDKAEMLKKYGTCTVIDFSRKNGITVVDVSSPQYRYEQLNQSVIQYIKKYGWPTCQEYQELVEMDKRKKEKDEM
ncbi:MAG: hypothetical protein ACI4HI_17970 [Lachnospiraceae bacterium]